MFWAKNRIVLTSSIHENKRNKIKANTATQTKSFSF